MKKSDIIVISFCGLIIAVSIFFITKGLMPSKSNKPFKVQSTINFTGNIDQGTIDKIQKRKDYGSPPMDNIGRDNPFGGL